MPLIFYFIWSVELIALLSMLVYLYKHRSQAGMILITVLSIAFLSESLSLFRISPASQENLKRDLTIFLQWSGYLVAFIFLLRGLKRKLVWVFLTLYVLSTLAFVLAKWHLDVNHSFVPYTIGALFILISVLMYFHQYLVVEQNDGSFVKSFFPLILAGLFVWIAAEVPLMTSIEYMVKNGLQDKLLPFYYTKIFANALYYFCYPIGLLWSMRS